MIGSSPARDHEEDLGRIIQNSHGLPLYISAIFNLAATGLGLLRAYRNYIDIRISTDL